MKFVVRSFRRTLNQRALKLKKKLNWPAGSCRLDSVLPTEESILDTSFEILEELLK
jgi:hypothetical protein